MSHMKHGYRISEELIWIRGVNATRSVCMDQAYLQRPWQQLKSGCLRRVEAQALWEESGQHKKCLKGWQLR